MGKTEEDSPVVYVVFGREYCQDLEGHFRLEKYSLCAFETERAAKKYCKELRKERQYDIVDYEAVPFYRGV